MDQCVSNTKAGPSSADLNKGRPMPGGSPAMITATEIYMSNLSGKIILTFENKAVVVMVSWSILYYCFPFPQITITSMNTLDCLFRRAMHQA